MSTDDNIKFIGAIVAAVVSFIGAMISIWISWATAKKSQSNQKEIEATKIQATKEIEDLKLRHEADKLLLAKQIEDNKLDQSKELEKYRSALSLENEQQRLLMQAKFEENRQANIIRIEKQRQSISWLQTSISNIQETKDVLFKISLETTIGENFTRLLVELNKAVDNTMKTYQSATGHLGMFGKVLLHEAKNYAHSQLMRMNSIIKQPENESRIPESFFQLSKDFHSTLTRLQDSIRSIADKEIAELLEVKL